MGSVFQNEFDSSYVPNDREINALRGIIVGHVEHGFPGSTGSSGWTEVGSQWVLDNVPNAKNVLSGLYEAGWTWEHEWFEGDYSMGMTGEAEVWCVANLGMPAGNLNEDEAHKIILEKIEPLFRRKTTRDVKSGFKAGIKKTSVYVTKTSYATLDEAAVDQERVLAALEKGAIKVGAARAYLAHITRRIAA